MQVMTTVDIRRPIEEVFAALTDVPRHPEWVGGLGAINNLSDNPVKIGTTWQQLGKLLGKQLAANVIVIAYDAPRRFGIESHGTGIGDGSITWMLESIPGGTRVEMTVDLAPSGLLAGLAAPFIKAGVQRQIAGDMQSLKKRLER